MLKEHTNLAPIVGLSLAHLTKHGQRELVMAACEGEDSAIKVMRKGIAISQLLKEPLEGICNLWPLADRDPQAAKCMQVEGEAAQPAPHRYLLLAYAGGSLVAQVDPPEENKEGPQELRFSDFTEKSGIAVDETTLWACNIAQGLILQVTPTRVLLLSASSLQKVEQFEMPEGESILIVEQFEEQLFLVTSLNAMIVLSLAAPGCGDM